MYNYPCLGHKLNKIFCARVEISRKYQAKKVYLLLIGQVQVDLELLFKSDTLSKHIV